MENGIMRLLRQPLPGRVGIELVVMASWGVRWDGYEGATPDLEPAVLGLLP